MQKYVPSLFLFSLALLFIMSGCKSAEQAKEQADQFYEHLKNRDYAPIYDMLDAEALKESPIEVIEEVFAQKEEYGKLKRVEKKVGFNTTTNNGMTYVTLNYKCYYDKLTFHERLVFVKRNKGFKIYSYAFNENERDLK